MWTYDGEVSRLAAMRGASPEYRAELMHLGPQKPQSGGSLMRLVEGERLHVKVEKHWQDRDEMLNRLGY